MRTDTPTPPASALDRVRSELARARRRLTDRARAWRRGRWPWAWALAALAVGAALALAYAAAVPSASAGGYVLSGERFSDGDLRVIRRALDAKGVAYEVDGRGRVEVAADRLAEANAELRKLDVGRQRRRDILKSALESRGFLDTLSEREQRQAEARNELLADRIRDLDGVADAEVSVNRRPRRIGQPAPAATAFVYLETEDGRRLSHKTWQSIVEMVASSEPDVRKDAVTVMDHKGEKYSDAADPTVTAQARERARAEGFEQEIKEKLDWITGVDVSVRFVPGPAVTAPLPAPSPAAASDPPTTPPLPPLPAGAAGPRPPAPAALANQPLEPIAEGPAPRAVEATPAPSAAPASPAAPAPGDPPGPPSRAQVWVKLPRSNYLRWAGKRELSQAEFQAMATRVEQTIDTAVRHVVRHDLLAAGRDAVKITTIPDELPAPAPPPVPADARRIAPWWGAAGGAAAVVLALGFRLVAARRPAPRPAARADRGRYRIDEPPDPGAGPGPSERVRELIRLNPEAAASVLHRWTGQGGPIG
jgi:flagellar biosynthesis/type III secretory pathway M-ring protein FliF/YscJ